MTSTLGGLADYVVGADLERDTVLRPAARAVLDTVCSALAGRAEATTLAAGALAAEALGVEGAPVARAWTTGAESMVGEAAFVNGVAGHALDLDDVSMSMWGHPSTLLVPVVLALGEAHGRSLGDALTAYAAGLHVDVALASGFDLVQHYAKGWHASVTVGSVGAVAAGARLMRLSREQTGHALGMAVSMASGTRQNFGTMTKPMHIGLAAENAVRACRLAALGVDSSEQALDGPMGFFALYGDSEPQPARVAATLATPEEESLRSLNVKRFPCCYQTHRAIDAALELRDGVGSVRADEVGEVVVHVNPGSDNSLIHPFATTPAQARFCMRYVVAAALLDGRVDFATFSPDRVLAEDVQALMRKVRLEHDVEVPYGGGSYSLDYAAVRVERSGGSSSEHRICTVPRGNADRPLDDDELVAKADACLAHGGFRAGGRQLLTALADPAAPVSALVASLRGLDPTAATAPERTTS